MPVIALDLQQKNETSVHSNTYIKCQIEFTSIYARKFLAFLIRVNGNFVVASHSGKSWHQIQIIREVNVPVVGFTPKMVAVIWKLMNAVALRKRANNYYHHMHSKYKKILM